MDGGNLQEAAMSVIDNLKEKYQLLLDNGDPRVVDWFWMQTPIPTVVLSVLYLIILYVGPKLMKNREPFQLKKALVVYNLGLVVLSAHITYEAFTVAIIHLRFNIVCEPMDLRPTEYNMRLCAIGWWFYVSKLFEFLDTIFFILRKKNNQISFLHCYHHVTMPINSWLGLRHAAGGSTVLFPMFNSFVHTLMYTYYGLAAMGPSMQKYLWWKKYMTKIQLLQLVSITFCLGAGIFMPSCQYPKTVSKFVMVYISTLIILFANFYYKAYIAKKHHAHPVSNGIKHHENGVMSNGVTHVKNGKVKHS